MQKRFLDTDTKKICTCIMVFFLLSRFAYLLIGLLYNFVNQTNLSIFQLLNQFDSGWYLTIADYGYAIEPNQHVNGDAANWAFSPLYPLAVNFFKAFIPLSTATVGVLVSNICIVIAAFFGSKYFLINNPDEDFRPFVFLILLGPYAFYFSASYPESMFLMFIVLCIYNLSRNNFVVAGVFSGLASATRMYGVFLVFLVIFELYKAYGKKLSLKNVWKFGIDILRTPKKLLSILLCPLGGFLYMIFLYIRVGDAWAFFNILRAWRGEPISILTALFKGNYEQLYLSVLVVGCAGTLLYLLIKKQAKEVLLGILILSQNTSSPYNIARHAVGTFFLPYGLTLIMNKLSGYKQFIYMALSIWGMILVYLWFSGMGALI